MSTYKIYNGTDWVNICDCSLNVLNSNNQWINVDPKKCQVRVWTGTEWYLIKCEIEEIED